MNKNTRLIYCRECRSQGSWVRSPAGDWVGESGRIMEYAYRCSQCGDITLRPEEAELALPKWYIDKPILL